MVTQFTGSLTLRELENCLNRKKYFTEYQEIYKGCIVSVLAKYKFRNTVPFMIDFGEKKLMTK